MTWEVVTLIFALAATHAAMFVGGSRFPYFTERQRERENARAIRAEARDRQYRHELDLKDMALEQERMFIAEQENRREERIEETMKRMYPGFGNPEPPDDSGMGPVPQRPMEAELERASKMAHRVREMEEAT